jgi:hypothetical protein
VKFMSLRHCVVYEEDEVSKKSEIDTAKPIDLVSRWAVGEMVSIGDTDQPGSKVCNV